MCNMVSLRVLLFAATCCQLCFPFMRHHSLNQGLGFSLFTIRGDKISPLSNSASDDAKKLPEIISIRSSTSKSVIANIVTFAAALAVLPTVAKARQGAFEMDVEYYLKTVASRAQGKPDATIDAKTAKPAFASARVIDKDIATSTSEIILEEISRVSKVPVSDVSKKVNVQLQLYLPYFKGFVPIRSEALSDQYYFDITLYASYIVAAQLIPKSTDRVILRKNVGDSILDLLIKKKLIRGSATEIGATMTATVAAERMTILAKGIKDILTAFATAKFVSSFTVDEDDIADKIFAESSFIEGLPVNFQYTLVSPINILGFLETAAADTFFHPEIIATTISSWARSLGYKAHYEDYLVDNYYLANGIDTNIVTAQDVLIEMQIATQNSDSPDF